MKILSFILITTITLFACSPKDNETESNTDDASMAAFKINSQLVLDGFEAFSKNDTATFNVNLSDTVKVHGPSYGEEAVVGREVLSQRLQGLHKLLSNIKANDIKLLPSMDEVTFKPDGGVRAYVRWTDDAIANGAKIEHKFYGVYQFNKDHKVVEIDEYMDITGIIKAATSPKK
jgi:hypothetical protein